MTATCYGSVDWPQSMFSCQCTVLKALDSFILNTAGHFIVAKVDSKVASELAICPKAISARVNGCGNCSVLGKLHVVSLSSCQWSLNVSRVILA